MTAIYIIAAVLIFLFSMTFVPLKIKVDLSFEFGKSFSCVGKIVFQWLFIKKTVSLGKENEPPPSEDSDIKEKKNKPDSNDKQNQTSRLKKVLDFFEGKSAKEIFNFLYQMLLILKDFSKELLKHTRFYKPDIKLCLVGSDAEKTALYYVRATPVCYGLLSYLTACPKHFVKPDIQLFTGFLSENSQLAVSSDINTKPFFILKNGFKYAIKLAKLIKF